MSCNSTVSLTTTEERLTTPRGTRIKLIKKKIVKSRNNSGMTTRENTRDLDQTKSQLSFSITENESGFLTMR